VEEGVLQLPAEQVLGRQVKDEPGPADELRLERVDPRLDEPAPHDMSQRLITVVRAGVAEANPAVIPEVVEELLFELRCRRRRHQGSG
jgi:hypothetical protein